MSCSLGKGEIIATAGTSIIRQDRKDQPQTLNKESKRTSLKWTLEIFIETGKRNVFCSLAKSCSYPMMCNDV